MFIRLYAILFFILTVVESMRFFNHWHCIGIKENIDFTKPYQINIGELPLVVWKDNTKDKLITTINICKHMGSKLHNGIITETGCLKCQYHGLELNQEDRFGETIEHQGKIFWSYKPTHSKPYSLPFYDNDNFATSFLEIDMECSLLDSAFNNIDLRHPEYVHNKLFGFGNTIPPQNIKQYKYETNERVGLSFDYFSNPVIRSLNDNVKITNNFHMYIYPTFSWSKVTFGKKSLLIGVNLLPLSEKKTRWYITLCHNYYKSTYQKKFVQLLATTILSQDSVQMRMQYKEDKFKHSMLFTHTFKDEEIMLWVKEMMKDYKYPDIDTCVELYKNYGAFNKTLEQ